MPTAKKPVVEETEPVVTMTLSEKIRNSASKNRNRWLGVVSLTALAVGGSVAKAYFNSKADLPTLES